MTYACQRPSFRNLTSTERGTYLSGRDADRIRLNDHLADAIRVEMPVQALTGG